ncbi:hypothetical protein Y032_0001g470 [Ancylostoma ceylanicum]|uniref:Uncharacterized protein n=1 Tax=Ancylostoma ceylanicum TaxID=53326 RepID=A0A016W5N9_9BILA|nr:hypothetical protein Y032_0001g470 [Ancylostoma ceylanicum]
MAPRQGARRHWRRSAFAAGPDGRQQQPAAIHRRRPAPSHDAAHFARTLGCFDSPSPTISGFSLSLACSIDLLGKTAFFVDGQESFASIALTALRLGEEFELCRRVIGALETSSPSAF